MCGLKLGELLLEILQVAPHDVGTLANYFGQFPPLLQPIFLESGETVRGGSKPSQSMISRWRCRLPFWRRTNRPSTADPGGRAVIPSGTRSPLMRIPPPASVRRASPLDEQRPVWARTSTSESSAFNASALRTVSGTIPRRASSASPVGG